MMSRALDTTARELKVDLPLERHEAIFRVFHAKLVDHITCLVMRGHHPVKVTAFLLDCIRREDAFAPDMGRVAGLAALIDWMDDDDGSPRCPVLYRIDVMLRAWVHHADTRWLSAAAISIFSISSTSRFEEPTVGKQRAINALQDAIAKTATGAT